MNIIRNSKIKTIRDYDNGNEFYESLNKSDKELWNCEETVESSKGTNKYTKYDKKSTKSEDKTEKIESAGNTSQNKTEPVKEERKPIY